MADVFQIPPLTLEAFLDRLRDTGQVVGILAMGTTAQPFMKPYSDYDLAIILGEGAPPIFTASVWINQQLGDLYFFSHAEVLRMLSTKTVEADSTLHKLLGWAKTGTLLYDPEKRLTQLRALPPDEIEVQQTAGQAHRTWFGINFNFAHNKRYFNSGDDGYLQALEVRLLYCLMDLLSGYFVLRGIPWKGEKAAIQYLQAHDPDYLASFQQAIRQSELTEKFRLYSLVVQRTTAEFGGIWADDEGSVLMKADAPVKTGIQWLRQLWAETRPSQ